MSSVLEAKTGHPSITTFRRRVREIMEAELSGSASRSIVILAIDGLPCALAKRSWPQAETTEMRSVFPTTSAAAWLSALSGLGVEQHGVPGAVMKLAVDDLEPVLVFEHQGSLESPWSGNVFTDAAALGYQPVAILGDLAAYPGAWRTLLLKGAATVAGTRFYTGAEPYETPCVTSLQERLRRAIAGAVEHGSARRPVMAWCFIELDRHVHLHGYDEHVAELLAATERLAAHLVEDGVVVIVHSDHGLVQTVRDGGLERTLGELGKRYGVAAGGAGRTRWLYSTAANHSQLREELEQALPPRARLVAAEEFFAPESLAGRRVGRLMLIAEGSRFPTSPGYRFDHGSLMPDELTVPFSTWGS